MVLVSVVLGAIVLVPVGMDTGVGGLAAARAVPVDPAPSRRPTSIGKPSPTPTSTPTDATAEPSDSSTATATEPTPDPSGGSTSTTSDPGGGSTGGPSAQSVDGASPHSPDPSARATTPSSAASPTGRTSNGHGNGSARDNRAGPKPGRGSPSSTAVAVAGRKVAALVGDDGRTAQEVDAAVAAPDRGTPEATVTTSASESSDPVQTAMDAGSTIPAPDRADVSPGQDGISVDWRLAATVAAFAAGLAVALLLAAARPRGGAHRRH